ncbi:MAG: hypothetical protein MPK62_07300 [Alphaproteobacteria bacterium]|nr:hypothetical protein [Alphaproteobacteria bacterium]
MLNNDKEEKRLRGLFKELSEKIKECLTEMPRISVDLPLFTVPDETAKQTNEHGRASGQADTAQTRKKRVIRKKRTKKKRKSKKRKKQQKPATTGRDLEARSAARYVDEGGEWRVILRVTPGKIDDKDDVYLSICLGEDRDDDQAKTHLDFVTAEQDGAKIPVSAANPSQIVLGPLAEDRSSDIIATVKKPDHIGDMQVGLLPILWLKRKP